jgi:hypothetical protein
MGYVFEYAPCHPASNKRGFVMQHRMLMEESLGRILRGTEVVHHEDEDKTNNVLSNLRLFASQSEHLAYHMRNEPQHSPELAEKLKVYAADSRRSYEEASADLGISVVTLMKCCRNFGIRWKTAAVRELDEQSVREALQGRTTKEAAELLGVNHQTLRNRFPHLLSKRVSPGFLDAHKEEIRNLAMSHTLEQIGKSFATSSVVIRQNLVRWSKQDGSTDALVAIQGRRRNIRRQ